MNIYVCIYIHTYLSVLIYVDMYMHMIYIYIQAVVVIMIRCVCCDVISPARIDRGILILIYQEVVTTHYMRQNPLHTLKIT
jgi:hypothetical protein